ncbi:CoA transferase subunit A [Demequina sp.]|uniref:CoA transferase subunit A n=1 Tax=Demequina sp. TaxID=2050685 RepID=UPI0025CCE86D|nr:CoA transferase subunit A [Demequina sp.]
MGKLHASAAEALGDVVRDGQIIAVGGFGLSGNPTDLIEALRDTGVRGLTIVSNNMGVDGKGLGILLESGQVSKVVASYVGENRLFAEQYLAGDLEVEFAPQGTLAERMRAGGAGIAGFYTRTGVGTPVAEGKPTAMFDGVEHVLERGIVADVALVKAHRADTAGNLRYRFTARNFNPLAAMSGRVTIAESDQVDPHPLDPDTVETPGIFVQRVVRSTPRVKDIEQRTTREA